LSARPSEQKPTVCLLACGDLGTALGLRLIAGGYDVLAVRRDPTKLAAQLPALALDYRDPEQVGQLAGRYFDAVVWTPTPVRGEAQGYRMGYLDPLDQLLPLWTQTPPGRVLCVSSTRVYGERDGAWVDDTSGTSVADDPAGAVIVAAEQRLRDALPAVTLLRLAGIYGRQPSRLLQRLARGEIYPEHPTRYSNRIHRDDAVGFIHFLLERMARGESIESHYLVADDDPASRWEVESWLCEQLGVTDLSVIKQAGPAGGNKRCRNTRLRASGYALQYPDYKAGYGAMLGLAPTAP